MDIEDAKPWSEIQSRDCILLQVPYYICLLFYSLLRSYRHTAHRLSAVRLTYEKFVTDTFVHGKSSSLVVKMFAHWYLVAVPL